VEGASGLVGCWFWTEAVVASQVEPLVGSCLEEENQLRALPNIVKVFGVEKVRRDR
jgi:hypothetical protein